jgi:hypothetical protein
MTMLARHPLTHKQDRYACLKRKMEKRHCNQMIQDKQMPSILSTLLTISCLIGVFTILAYFRPH